jgi:hypothetical protein
LRGGKDEKAEVAALASDLPSLVGSDYWRLRSATDALLIIRSTRSLGGDFIS